MGEFIATRRSLFGSHQDDPDFDSSSFPGVGQRLGDGQENPWWGRRVVLNTDDEDEPRRVDSTSSSQGASASALDSSPTTDRRHLDVPVVTHRRHTRSSGDRRRSFHTAEEMEKRRSYYLDDRSPPSYMRRSSSDRRSDLSGDQASSSQDEEPMIASTSRPTITRRRFYVSESDSDVRLDELLRAARDVRNRSPHGYQDRTRSLTRRDYHRPERSRTNSDSNSDDDLRPGSAYSSCGSVNEIVDRFKDYNRRVRNMVVNSLADLDDNTLINQGTSESRQPQLGFHTVHGQNVGLQSGGRIARRKESFCKGLAFSNRPITVDENVCIRLNEVASNWSGVMRFGVTNVDPEVYRGGTIPKFACPDLTCKDGYWAKALPERYSIEGHIINFYVTADGELFYGINGTPKGLFLSGINVRLPLWVIVDIYGNSVSVEFIDANDAKLRASRAITSSANPSSSQPTRTAPPRQQPAQSAATVSDNASTSVLSGVDLDLLQFHRVTGRHVTLNGLRTMATRSEQEYTQGYVFTERPIRFNEKVMIQVVAVQNLYSGSLAFGVTCCDPKNLVGKELPDDSSDLIEMPDYFVGIKDVALNPVANTLLQFWINSNGEVKFQKDQKQPRTIMHVDATLQLYMWFDVYGQTQVIKLLGCYPASRPARPAPPAVVPPSPTTTAMPTRVALPVLPNSTSRTRRGEAASPQRDNPSHSTPSPIPLRVAMENMRLGDGSAPSSQRSTPAIPPRRASSAVDDLLSSDIGSSGGPPALSPANAFTLNTPQYLPIITPPTTSTTNPFTAHLLDSVTSPTARAPPPLAPRPPTMGQNRSAPTLPPNRPPLPPPISTLPSIPQVTSPPSTTPSKEFPDDLEESEECTICMNAKINCVIYKCGHMCMCYDCAVTLKDQKGECPMCRKPMDDVIKCFKS
ncbi:unnamed protein product, partial [Mesorhabditis belari]|uniref:Neuralized n=1 Tax=Mesorhabditis belari TaxID=2138241 RepID=A0AAF3ENL1_9BILA